MIQKHVRRFYLAGLLYLFIELAWRTVVQHRSPSIMVFFMAGIVSVLVLHLEDKHINIFISSFIGALIVTLQELVVGLIFLYIFDTRLWEYSTLTYNGVVSLSWSLLWYLLCYVYVLCYRMFNIIFKEN